MIVGVVISGFHTTSFVQSVRRQQDDVEASKLVHVTGSANPDPNELLMRLAPLYTTGHLVFGSLRFLGSAPCL